MTTTAYMTGWSSAFLSDRVALTSHRMALARSSQAVIPPPRHVAGLRPPGELSCRRRRIVTSRTTACQRADLETGLVPADERGLDHEVQVVLRAGDERVRLTRLHHEHVPHPETDLPPRHLGDALTAGHQVDLVHQLVAMRYVAPPIRPSLRYGQARVPGPDLPTLPVGRRADLASLDHLRTMSWAQGASGSNRPHTGGDRWRQ